MAAIDFPASPTVGQLFTAGNGVTYKWSGTMWLPIGGASMLSIGDSPPGSPGNGQLWWNSTRGEMFIWYSDGSSAQWVPSTPLGNGGSVVQTVSTQTGAVATGTTVIPFDDTIPQIGEGNEYMTLAITPRSATSKLVIEVTAVISNGASNHLIVALFQDAAANAVAAVEAYQASGGGPLPLSFRHTMTSGTTGATTFRVRAGANGAGTTTFNGSVGGRIFGGVMASSIVIQEVL